MELADEVYGSLNKYFSILSHVGYKQYNEVYKLIVYIFIEELLDGEMSYFINESDYKELHKALSCLYGICMIPYPEYKKGIELTVNRTISEYRITETDNIIRSLENGQLKIKS